MYLLWLVVGVLIHAMLHSVNDLKAAQINLQCCLIWEHMLYKDKIAYNAVKVRKDICCAKADGVVDHNTISRWSKKIFPGCALSHRGKFCN